MPSLLHEALLVLFRNRPSLAPELLRDALGVPLPEHETVRLEDADLTQVVPTAYHADLVVLLLRGAPVLGIVVEAQLARDEEKRFTWPLYAAALRARLRCPACVLVVAPDPQVAAWASRPIETGQPRSAYVPLVLGPGAVPVVTDGAEAAGAPELAVLSALAHGHEERAVEVALAALGAAAGLDQPRALLYTDLVYAALNEAARRALEVLMSTGRYEYQSEFARKYFGEGKAEGKAEGLAEGKAEAKAEVLLKILAGRGVAVTDEQRSRVLVCRDLAQLDRWIDRAFQATSADAALAE